MWNMVEMKINTLLYQEKLTKLNLSNISFYLIINIPLNKPYITMYNKMQQHDFSQFRFKR